MRDIFNVDNLKSSYRKYKSMVYYDTYGAIDRLRIADFEEKNNIHINDDYFMKLSQILELPEAREKKFGEILSSVRIRCYPKKVQDKAAENNDDLVISNVLPHTTNISSLQYQIDLHIEGHIIGILWVMEFGKILDDMLIENCFGNRLKSYICTEKKHSISPFLFEPYFKNYESWRDGALNIAQQQLEDKKNVLVITLDIKSYYYYSRIDFLELNNTLQKVIEQCENDKLIEECKITTDFVEGIFKKYSELFFFSNGKVNGAERPLIPVGFAPSMVIANWYLNDFDRKIQRELHPIYYGRYVDDILVVLPSYSDIKTPLKVSDVIDMYFTKSKEYPQYDFLKNPQEDDPKEDDTKQDDTKQDARRGVYYFTQEKYNQLSVQMNKFKVYLFRHEEPQAMINKFRREIQHNSSEFRYMFEKTSISKHIEDEIYTIEYEGTINKIRSINGIKIDKYKLSKTLSKLIYASVENSYDKYPKLFEVLTRVFNAGNSIDLFTFWEKILTLLFIQKRYTEIFNLVGTLEKLIRQLTFERDDEVGFYLSNENDLEILRSTLWDTLKSSLYRVVALRANKEVLELISNIEKKYEFCPNDIETYRKKYLVSQLINSKITRNPIQNFTKWTMESDYDLIFGDCLKSNSEIKSNGVCSIQYFPRFIHLHECFLQCIADGIRRNEVIKGIDYFSKSLALYKEINFMNSSIEEQAFFNVTSCPCDQTSKIYENQNKKLCEELNKGERCSRFHDQVRINKIRAGNECYSKLRVGIASVQVYEKDICDAWLGRPNISVERMDKLIEVVNLAAKEDVNLLVMPECYIPYCWTGHVIEAARKHNIAMVFGVEHISKNGTVYNYLMTVLPLKVDGYINCVVKMRLKNFYSPNEEKGIRNYNLNLPREVVDNSKAGSHFREYDLFCWNGVSFAPYNCFELTHITDRALFKSEIDMLIACEDNKDTGYFASIIDSLALDLHCYCVQVNASQHGDSKIAQPKSSNERTILSIKGGDNVFLIVGDVNVKELREFQVCATSSSKFKPLPPGFDYQSVRTRMGLAKD